MPIVEIDLADARELAFEARCMVIGDEHEAMRAAILLMAAAWLVINDQKHEMTQEQIDAAIRQCQRRNICPCRVVVDGPPDNAGALEITQLTPMWAAEIRSGVA